MFTPVEIEEAFRKLFGLYNQEKVCFDLPGHNHPIAFLEPSEELYNAMYIAGIDVIGQLLEADDRKLLTEYRLDRSEIDKIAELMKKKGYSCNITRARNNIRIAYWRRGC